MRPEIAKKIKELFRTKMSSFIVCCLNAYRKPSCTTGRITSNEDFKYLARKVYFYLFCMITVCPLELSKEMIANLMNFCSLLVKMDTIIF